MTSAALAWSLDPSLVFLNHGSFGACPSAVLDHQARLQRELERSPVQFMLRRLPALLDDERQVVARFVGVRPADLAFVGNATAGVNAVLRSLTFSGGELLTTSHTYAACKNALDYVAQRHGLSVTVAQVPFPIASPAEVTEAILAAVSGKTRLALIDHVTSITGLVFPVATLAHELEHRGIPTLIDGAHAPGMVELDISTLGASYYVANFHKWVCSPKGAAMLWVREDRQASVVPLVVSHGYSAGQARFQALFDWQGTLDPTAVLSISSALSFMGRLHPEGWPGLRRRNRELALAARDCLCACLNIDAPAPDSMLGSLASVPLAISGAAAPELYERLFGAGFETLVLPSPSAPNAVLRVSAQAYNFLGQYQNLAQVLPGFLAEFADSATRQSATTGEKLPVQLDESAS
jgi:isopenicillin-N epimerase